jgi:hypothetical protein
MEGSHPMLPRGSIGSSFNLLSLVIAAASLHGVIGHAVHDPTNQKPQKVVRLTLQKRYIWKNNNDSSFAQSMC